MTGRIPRRSSDCVHCNQAGKTCSSHTGRNGQLVDYAGPDLYVPSDWVASVVGGEYRGSGRVWTCTGYDPRTGFWMRATDGDRHVTNVSERAIDRTFHRVRSPLI
jgi:hypothetical protein